MTDKADPAGLVRAPQVSIFGAANLILDWVRGIGESLAVLSRVVGWW